MKKHRKKQKKRVHMECHIFYYHVISVTNMIIAIYFGNLGKARRSMMYCPKCQDEMRYTGWFNLYGGGTYICNNCNQKVTVMFEDIEEESEVEHDA
jgi:hypothetical protein